MTTLSLDSIKAAVGAAFDHWLDQETANFNLQLEDHDVEVTIAVDNVNKRFNCGIPGYNMASAAIGDLAAWVPDNITTAGIKGAVAPLKDGKINVWLKGVHMMFNFHVYIV
jgi:hypothetical protein